MSRRLLEKIAELEDKFEEIGGMDLDEVENLFAADPQLLVGALHFLRERERILVDPIHRRIWHRMSIERSLLAWTQGHERTAVAQVAGELGIPSPILCQVIGWLERDRRIDVSTDPDGLCIAAPRPS